MSTTDIEWCDAVWNPVRGCARVSAGCEECYAERQAHRFSGHGQPYQGLTVLGKHGPRWTGRARFEPAMLGAPFAWRKPRRVFVNSMSDLFHDDIADEDIAAVFGIMAWSPQHTFQVLTKRPERMQRLLSKWTIDDCWWATMKYEALGIHDRPSRRRKHESREDPGVWTDAWPLPNVWVGVSVEDQQRADERIPLLRQTPAAKRWLSMEPLLEEVSLSWRLLDAIDWVVVGGESGCGARPCDLEWIRHVLRSCATYDLPCFVKQLGRRPFDWTSPLDRFALKLTDSKGGDMAEWPAELRLREFPRNRSGLVPAVALDAANGGALELR